MFNLQHLQNYYDHHLHAIYVLVLFDWCHFVWNFPYGFIVHIFVCVNGSTPMCWAKAIVSLTGSHSSPLGCLQFDCCVECISEKVLAWARALSFPLCFLMSAHWAYIPADELARPERMPIRPSSNWSHCPSLLSIYVAKFGSYTSLVCVTSLRIGMDKPSSL